MEELAVHPTASDCLGYFANKLSVDSDALIKKIYANALLDKDSLAASHLTSVVMDAMKSEMNKYARNTLRTMTIPQSLKPDEQEALKVMYPEYTLNFTNNTCESHNFAHASRIIETVLCMNKMSYFSNYKIRKKPIILKDIGGNRVFHALRGHTAVHVCAPILSHVDAHRQATSNWRLSTSIVAKNDYHRYNAVQLLKRPSTHYCTNLGQNCSVMAPALMFIHSIYDMTPVEVADSMSAADATIGMGTFIYDPRILLYDTGRLPLLNVVWKKYVKGNKKYIDFTFIGDAQPVYTHSLQVYLSYLETTYITDSCKSNIYTFQFNENRNGIQFFTIMRIDAPYVPASTIKINHTLISQENFLMVTYYEWVEKISIVNRGKMRKIQLLVPTTLWEQAYDMLKQQSDGSFTVAKAMEFMICYNKKTIINGQTVSHHQKCTSQVLDKLAYALYVRVYIDKYLASNTLTAILDDINNVRELTKMGPLKAMYTIMKDKIKNFFFPTIDAERTIAPYCAWATMSTLYKYPVDIRDAVTFKSVNTIIPEIVQLHKRNNDFGAIQEIIGEETFDITPIEKPMLQSDIEPVTIEPTVDAELFAGPMGVMPVSCSRSDGEIIDVPGDGDCFFHSTIHHMNNSGAKACTPQEMRTKTNNDLRSNVLFNNLDSAIKSDLSYQLVGAGGNQPVCILVCKAVAIIYRFNLCVHFHKNDIFNHTELYTFDQKYTTYHYYFNSYGDSNVGHFQPIIFDNTYTASNEMTCDAELQLIKEETVLSTDNLIETLIQYDADTILNAKNRIQSTDILHGYVGNCVLPIISILNDGLNCDLDNLNALDICSGPGSVSQYLIEQGVRSVVAVTDNPNGQLYHHSRIAQNYMDITNLQLVLEFIKVNSNMEFDIVIADGNGPNNGYEFNRNLMICELMISLSLLNDGGNLIIRSWRYKYLEQCMIIEILQLHFADVTISRPYPLLRSDDVNYIVCTNFVKPKNFGHMDTFLGMLVGNFLNSTVVPGIVLEDIDNYYYSVDTLLTFVRNTGLNSDNNILKENYMKMIPGVDLDSDISGGVMPDLRPVKLGFVTALVQAMLNDLDEIMYPYIGQHTVMNLIGVDLNTTEILSDGLRFYKSFYAFCKTLNVNNINSINMTNKITYKVQDKTISFMCTSCEKIQYIPKCGGFYACKCDVRNKLYATVDDILMSQSVLSCTCNKLIKRGAVINVTMDYDKACYEYDVHCNLQNDKENWGKYRSVINSNYEVISRDLMQRLGSEVSDIVMDNDTIPEKVEEENGKILPGEKTITDGMLDTIDTQIGKPELEEDPLVDDGTTVTRLKKAFHECYNIWKMTDHNHTVTLKRLLSMVLVSKPSREMNTYLENADSEPYVRIDNVWYPRKPVGDYMFEYNGCKYEGFNLFGDKPAIVSEYTRKKFEPTFIDKCGKYYKQLFKEVVRTKFDLVSGVPGCGKTTYIMKNHKIGDLVLSATREGAREFRKRASEAGETDVERNYRTVYSYLYNSHDKYDTVYVDEAMMMHPGMMYAITCASKCKRLVMVGDVRQIPYYVRIDYDATYHKFDSVFPVTSYLHVSYRCPQDVAVLMRNYYEKFVSASKVIKSLNVRYISGKNDVPAGFDIYLTFSQSDKEILATVYDNVNTIHEYQGKQAKRVALYRGSPTMLKLYDSIEHHIVALTRHTNTLTYFSVIQDSLYKSIENLKGGSLTTGVNIQYLTTSLFASNKYSIFHFTSKDMLMKSGIDCDIKSRIKDFQQIVVNKSLGGLIYTYDTVNHRYIFHLLTHKKYTDKPELGYIKTSIYNLRIWLNMLNVNSVHTSINYNGNWYELESVLKTLQTNVIIHDPKGKYDRYRLTDIILDYHHEQTGPNLPILSDARERDILHISRRQVVMPDVYVLVYAEVEQADLDLQKKFHYVPIHTYNDSRRNICMNRVYKNYCVLMNKSYLNKTPVDYNCKKYFSSALMKRNFKDKCDNLQKLQQFNDNVLPNAYGIDTSMDVKLVAMSDITYHIQDCSFNAGLIHTPLRTFECVKPKLVTAMCPPRPTNSLKEVLKAVEKRNCAVPKIQLTMDVYATAVELYKNFIKYMCVDDQKMDNINFNADIVEDWLTTQDNNIVNLIQKQSISDMALNKYSLTIKKNSKPLLDMSCVNTYAALQTVVFSAKDFNTYFCPIFRCFKKNLMSKLVDKVLLMADMAPCKFAEIMTKQINKYDMSAFYSLEIDVSKYDKSQALVHLLVDCFILRHFGVSDVDVNRWFVGHVFTVLRDPSTRLTSYNFFQRKSGDPSTWILNTVQVLVMIVNVIDVSQWDSIALILASGDDSELISLERLRINQKRFADIFNYEVKIFDNYRSIYFCSKFLIFDSNNDVYIIPDMFKMIKKLGRHDLKNREHLVSYRKSVLDGLRDFIVPDRVKIEYVTALSERYKCSEFSYDTVVNALFNISIEDDAFEELYVKNPMYYCFGFGDLSDI